MRPRAAASAGGAPAAAPGVAPGNRGWRRGDPARPGNCGPEKNNRMLKILHSCLGKKYFHTLQLCKGLQSSGRPCRRRGGGRSRRGRRGRRRLLHRLCPLQGQQHVERGRGRGSIGRRGRDRRLGDLQGRERGGGRGGQTLLLQRPIGNRGKCWFR